MSKWQTLNEALDLTSDCGTDEDKSIKPKERAGNNEKLIMILEWLTEAHCDLTF